MYLIVSLYNLIFVKSVLNNQPAHRILENLTVGPLSAMGAGCITQLFVGRLAENVR